MLRGRRVLLEPSSMELRFVEEPLKPKIELDQANAKAVRVRVVFEGGNRRFPLSGGNWFEGTPGWHIEPADGVARPVSGRGDARVAAAALPFAGAGASGVGAAAPVDRVHPASRGLARRRASGI